MSLDKEATAVEMIDDVADALRERDEEKQAQALQGCCDALYASEPIDHLTADSVYRLVFDAVRRLAKTHGFLIEEVGPPLQAVCVSCGGKNVRRAMWVDMNTQEIMGSFSTDRDSTWCPACGEHVQVEHK